ncbi:MAG: hypothetical protein QGH94_14170 [Phycisphaerae bacterium]|jgi:hypothetical protein|nr:hypothetical protein [Phycisphaerae bacterium]
MRQIAFFVVLVLVFAASCQHAGAADGVYVRFKLTEPAKTAWCVRLGGYIHKSPWYLPRAVWPKGADKDKSARIASGEFSPWLDFGQYAGKRFHGRMRRAGGLAEFPNATADFITDTPSDKRSVVIEIATKPSPDAIVKRLTESYSGSLTSFLISPNPKADADSYETASQMTDRRLAWAKKASGSKRASPKNHIIQTSFWSPQRPELNLKEAEVLWLLGFNVVGNQRPEVIEKFAMRKPAHTHRVLLAPSATREQINESIKTQAARKKEKFAPGVPFGFSDEVVCRPVIGTDKQALAHFHKWLEINNISPKTLGVSRLGDVVPLETPKALTAAMKINEPAARRVFYYSSRFRQRAATERLKWNSDAVHKHFGKELLTSTLVADHPYFSGSGLGMGMTPNPTWGGSPLAADWFDIARSGAVDLIGIEDWMGLQYMYGPNTTWEGFQLMGFQAAIFRSGSRARHEAIPTIAWITPSDETNLRLKTASAMCQGAKHFFYWTYGPTATSTENYWSDLRGAYDGVVGVTRQLAAAEHIIAPGRQRRTKVALLYSISSDLWQPFGYIHMLERRLTYLSLIHDQYLVDMVTEEDVAAGRLGEYKVFYVTDPCVSSRAVEKIKAWVIAGGHIYGSCAAGSQNEFGEPVEGLSKVFGVRPSGKAVVQPGRYHIRGALNGLKFIDKIQTDSKVSFGALGVKVPITPSPTTKVTGKFADGSPAVVRRFFGRGKAIYTATCPGLSYGKDAKFVPAELKEDWPAVQRGFINAQAKLAGAERLVKLSHPVVEAGLYDAKSGTALVLANFTYKPIKGLKVTVRIPNPRRPKSVKSVESGPLKFSASGPGPVSSLPQYPHTVTFTVDLGLSDIILIE